MSEIHMSGASQPAGLPNLVKELERESVRRDVTVDGCRIAIRQWGSGMPLVLFHGGHGSWLHWYRNVHALARHHTVFLVDLPGFGDSDNTVFSDMASYSVPVARAVDQLLPETRFAIGGFSFGSSVAVFACRLLSNRLEHLFMVGSPILSERVDLVRDQLVRWRDMDNPAQQIQAHATNLRILMLGPETAVADKIAAVQHAMTTRARLRYRPGKAGEPGRQILRELRPRITAIWGAEDVLVRNHFQSARSFLEGLENGSCLHILPGAGHWVQFERDEAVSSLIIDALAR